MTKKLLAATAISGLCLAAPQAMALDLLGSPIPSLSKGGWAIEAEYAAGEAEIERLLSPTWTNSGTTSSTKHKFDDITKMGVKVSYGIAENVEAFARIGQAEADTQQFRNNGLPAFSMNGDGDTYWGAGLKVFLCTFEGVKIGLTGQWSTVEYNATGENDWWGAPGTLFNTLDELQVAVGGETALSDGINVFGGAVFQQVTGDSYFQEDGGDSSNRQPLEEDSTIGFYVGGSWRVMQNVTISGEYQAVGDDNLMGASLRWAM